MTKIVVVITPADLLLPDGVDYAATAIVVVDNSGATLPAQTVNGTEAPPWTATFTGATGTAEVTVTATALDTNGNTLGTPLTGTETGTGGQPARTFPAPASLSITVT